MRLPRTWVAVGTAAVLGAGGTAVAAGSLNDRAAAADAGSGISLSQAADGSLEPVRPLDPSPESPDSPDESPVDSADSPSDSPDDPGYA
ncbi:MAG TPA: hypothetical protein VNU66_11520, partial [Mycobacteriales bacterium]|nr:hypothetical protein [Mycobacteriales bacterium]